MLAPAQSPASPRRNADRGTCWIARWIACKPSSFSLARQRLRRVSLSLAQVRSPAARAMSFQAETTIAQSSLAGAALRVGGDSPSGWVWVEGLDLFSLGRREREGLSCDVTSCPVTSRDVT